MSLAVLEGDFPRPISQSSSVRVVSKANRPTALRLNRTDPDLGLSFDDTDSFPNDDQNAWKTLDNIAALGLTLENNEEEAIRSVGLPTFSVDADDASDGHLGTASSRVGPFHKWMKNLHRRAHRPRTHRDHCRIEPFPEYPEYPFWDDLLSPDGHRKSSSGSSFGFVAAVRSASVSLASASVIRRSRRHTARSSLQGRTDLSSRGSTSAPRCSEDSTCLERISTDDPGVTERLLQRRRILEELINTEESYIGDVKFLMNVYVTILASLPSPHLGLRSSINRNLTDIVELHEEILGELHRVVPNSEYTQPERIPITPNSPPVKKHNRWHSLDSVPEDKGGASSWLQNIPSVIAEPSVAAEVAHVFGKRQMNRFFIYEEYGAKYEMMIKDVASAHRTLPQWETYQKGLEALAASLGAANHHLNHSKKSLTIGDLLVKPIQRICRYPLLFSELLKYTPVCDCPSSHMEIENVLIRLREATAEINRATDDPRMKTTMEQTWLLQDRLVFPNQKLDAASKSTIRSFGQVRLCGVLHVCWQTKDGVDGAYMVTLLYKDCLCLATASRAGHVYPIQACLSLGDIKVEEVDNGRVILKNTSTVKDNSAAVPTSQINRSQSFLTTNSRIPVLAPSRGDRARLEALLADVWSRKVLPFPGITNRSRSEHLVRSSASTVMRKLSVASITSSFAKRSTSATSATKFIEDEQPHISGFVDGLTNLNSEETNFDLVEAEEDIKQRLPIIRDETEHTGSPSPSISSAVDTCAQSGTVKRLDSSRLDLKWLDEESGFDIPSLRTSPPNSIRRNKWMPSMRSSPSASTDEENMYQGLGTKHRLQETLTNTRATSKWPRVGAINRGLMASSIRSLFR
ncbi:hypothetical protein AAE478_000947 [Parahypoxylon ruwenzoriense]